MKKGIILIALSFLMAFPAMGQQKLVKSVERMVKKDKADLVEARKLIEPALTNEETANDPYAWYVAGLVEEKAVEKDYLAMQLGQEIKEDVFYNNLMNMVKFYRKTNELDSRNKFEKKISGPLSTYYQLLVNGGATFLDDGKFKEANEYFQAFLDVKKMEMFKDSPVSQSDSLSMQIGFFNAYAASQIEDNAENAIKAFESIKDIEYRQNDVYQLLSLQYYNAKDNENFIKTLKDGAALFPEESFYVNNIIDAYIKQNQLDEAKSYLDIAISEHPDNAQLYYTYGFLYENGYQDTDKAIEYYTKATEIDPTYAQGFFGIGRCHFNAGHALINNVDLSDQEKYKEATVKSEKLFKQSIPFFEKAIELEPDNQDFLRALSNCYYVLGMEEERAKIEDKLSTM
ncbi:tetratricopeptide repeat protein [Porphyromonadaceae bacterium W3.11]|nr:tetratricopeptide repeat protein [Porphyromonadaceae bacterium W3.11]